MAVLYIFLGVLGILAIVGIVFANGVSVLWASFIFFGIFIFIITLLTIVSDNSDDILKKVDLLGKLRRCLTGGGGFSIPGLVQRILILVMSAASVALIVRAIIFVVNAFSEFTQDHSSMGSMDWLLDLMADVPVLNVVVLMKQSFETELRPDFFAVVLMLSLVVMGIAAAVVQLIMALVNKVIYEAKEESMLFRILGTFSISVLMVAGTMFLSSLISPLLDFSKPWDGFEDFCRPFLQSNVGNFLLQVLVTVAMYAVLVVICSDWVRTMVLGGAGLLVYVIFTLILQLIVSIFTGGSHADGGVDFFFLLCFLYPIIDIIKNILFKDDDISLIWLPVAVPLALSMIMSLIEVVIGKAIFPDDFASNAIFIGILVFIVYLLAMPGIEIARGSDE